MQKSLVWSKLSFGHFRSNHHSDVQTFSYITSRKQKRFISSRSDVIEQRRKSWVLYWWRLIRIHCWCFLSSIISITCGYDEFIHKPPRTISKLKLRWGKCLSESITSSFVFINLFIVSSLYSHNKFLRIDTIHFFLRFAASVHNHINHIDPLCSDKHSRRNDVNPICFHDNYPKGSALF